jgi:hypothetical protein
MNHAENNTQMERELKPVSSQRACTSAAAKSAAAAVVSGPSCPAAFARWWAEYQEKVMKTSPSQESGFALEGRP